MSSSKLAAVHEMAWTLPARIILASEMPNSAVLMAPAMASSILPPARRGAFSRLATRRRSPAR